MSIAHEPALIGVLASAVRRRHDALQHTAGLNAEVFDGLVLISAGSWTPDHVRRGYEAVTSLVDEMYVGRKKSGSFA